MERIIKFDSIDIEDTSGKIHYFQNEVELFRWFKHNSHIYIKSIPNVTYHIDGETVLLKIIRQNSKWDVSNFNDNVKEKINFSFECNSGLSFKNELDTALKKFLNPELYD
jgi:hypothetical protein